MRIFFYLPLCMCEFVCVDIYFFILDPHKHTHTQTCSHAPTHIHTHIYIYWDRLFGGGYHVSWTPDYVLSFLSSHFQDLIAISIPPPVKPCTESMDEAKQFALHLHFIIFIYLSWFFSFSFFPFHIFISLVVSSLHFGFHDIFFLHWKKKKTK